MRENQRACRRKEMRRQEGEGREKKKMSDFIVYVIHKSGTALKQ